MKDLGIIISVSLLRLAIYLTPIAMIGVGSYFGGLWVSDKYRDAIEWANGKPSTVQMDMRTAAMEPMPGGPDYTVGNVNIDCVALAISGHESGGDYNIVHRPGKGFVSSGAKGAYQFMPGTWRAMSKNILGYAAPMTRENQDRVAKSMMAKYAADGHGVRDIAKYWYGGDTKDKKGVNQYGPYDTGAYADEILRRYTNICGDTRLAQR
jgi:hypothetical protein